MRYADIIHRPSALQFEGTDTLLDFTIHYFYFTYSLPFTFSMFSASRHIQLSSDPQTTPYVRELHPYMPSQYLDGPPSPLNPPTPLLSSEPKKDPNRVVHTYLVIKKKNTSDSELWPRQTHPLNMSCGLAAPDVRFRMSCTDHQHQQPFITTITHRPQTQSSPQQAATPTR